MAKNDSGEWMNIFTDGRSFKKKQSALRHKKLFSWGRPYETRIDEVEVLTIEEKLKAALEDAESSAISFEWIAANTTGTVSEYASGCAELVRKEIGILQAK